MYLEKLRLDGRAAFVTGGAQGIGLAVAEALAEAGAKVTIADRDAAALDLAVAALADKGYAVFPALLDVTDSPAVDAAAAAMLARDGGVDILINNAAIARSETPPEDVADEHWLHLLDANLNASFSWSRSFGWHILAPVSGGLGHVGPR